MLQTYIYIYIVGYSDSGKIASVKYSTNGNLQWVANHPGEGIDIVVDKFNNVYVTGYNSDSGTYGDYVTINIHSL